MNAVSGSVRRITISAVFLSLSLVLKTTLTFDLPLFGQNGMRIGISGIFSILPALLFGPGYGAAVSGLSDFLGFLIKPTGGYLPLLTISAAAGGFLRGFLWEILKKKEDKRMRLLIAAGSGVLLVLGLGSALMTGEGMTPTAAGAAGGALLGMLLLAADFILSKKILPGGEKRKLPQLLIVMIVSGLAVITVNTVILRETICTAWKTLPFIVVWLPRAAEELLGNIVLACFAAVLLPLSGKFVKNG